MPIGPARERETRRERRQPIGRRRADSAPPRCRRDSRGVSEAWTRGGVQPMGSRPSSGIGGRPAAVRRGIGVSREPEAVKGAAGRGLRRNNPEAQLGGVAADPCPRMFHASLDQKMELVFIFKKILSVI
ncbi:hypothetical protein VULLAG_LOCUS241 [Vulpes lagopus]